MGGRVIACLVVAAAVSGLAGVGPASAATSIGYNETHTQTVDPGSSLNTVSCIPATTTCVAAGAKGNAFYSTNVSATAGATWTSWAGPSGQSPAEAVACPSTTLCILADGAVTGGGGNVYRATSLGGSFLTSFTPGNGVNGLSCPTTSFCVASEEGEGFIRYSTKPSGTVWSAVEIGTGAMKAASCLSASFCAVVDDTGNIHVAVTEKDVKEAAGWKATNIDGTTPLKGIVCTSTSLCIAVDGSGSVLNLTIGPNGEATASEQDIEGAAELLAITCNGATCAAVDSDGAAFSSTNGGADWDLRFGGGAGFTSVSCASAALCAAVTTAGDITTFNPASTVAPLIITSDSLPAGTANAHYEAQVRADGGTPPYQWSATGLPLGLSIDQASGRISGTPVTTLCVRAPCPQLPATYTPTVTVTDSHGTQASSQFEIALAAKTYALKVTTTGAGSGEVSSSPAGINGCGTPAGTCEASYYDGTEVTLAAKPAAGSRFAGWSGGCSGTDACQLTIGADKTLSARFVEDAAPPAPAGLRIRHVGSTLVRSGCAAELAFLPRLHRGCTKLRIAVGGTIAAEARGTVSVKVSEHLHGRRVTATKRAQIQGGHWHARFVLPAIDRNAAIYISANFTGSPGVQSGHPKRHMSSG